MSLSPQQRQQREEILRRIVYVLTKGAMTKQEIEMACHITGKVRRSHLRILESAGIVIEVRLTPDKKISKWKLSHAYRQGLVMMEAVL